MPYNYNEDNIKEIRESNDIVEVISQHITLKRTGTNHVGLCPFHNEKTPSFSVSSSKQMYHCFGCGAGGDVISFSMKYLNIDFVEALDILADRANIILDEKEINIDTEKNKEKSKIYELNKEAARYFYSNLINDEKSLGYLYDRGISQKVIKSFGLGYSINSWDGILLFLKKKGYSEQEIEKAGLLVKHKDGKRYYDRFRGRIIFPIIDVRGRVIGFGGRVILDAQPKYLNSPDTPVFLKGNNLYGLNIAKNYSRNKIILVEGYIDVISLYQYGINYCVASLGTAFTPSQAKMLKRYSNDIYICYDSDNAGLNATDRALDVFKAEKINAKAILLPTGKDPDDYIKENSKENFEQLSNKAYSYIDFKIHLYKKKYNLNTVDGKISFTREISNMLKQIESPIEIDAYLNKISLETKLSIDAIKEEMQSKQSIQVNPTTKDKYINTNYRYNNKDKILPVRYNQEAGHLMAEKNLLNFIIYSKKIYIHIKDRFKIENFLNPIYRRAAEIVYDIYDSGKELSEVNITTNFEGEELEKLKEVLILGLDFDEEEKLKAVDDYIKKIYYYNLKIRKKDIKEQIAEIENNTARTKGDVGKLKQLCTEIIDIEKELKLQQ